MVLEETGSSAGPYTPFHDQVGEAAFTFSYIGMMAKSRARLHGAHWWVSSDIYTEHSGGINYTRVPHETYSGGMPLQEFTGRWGYA